MEWSELVWLALLAGVIQLLGMDRQRHCNNHSTLSHVVGHLECFSEDATARILILASSADVYVLVHSPITRERSEDRVFGTAAPEEQGEIMRCLLVMFHCLSLTF